MDEVLILLKNNEIVSSVLEKGFSGNKRLCEAIQRLDGCPSKGMHPLCEHVE